MAGVGWSIQKPAPAAASMAQIRHVEIRRRTTHAEVRRTLSAADRTITKHVMYSEPCGGGDNRVVKPTKALNMASNGPTPGHQRDGFPRIDNIDLSASPPRDGFDPTVPPRDGRSWGHPAMMPLAAMTGDFVTAVLQRIRLSTWIAGRSVGAEDWSMRVPTGPGGFYAVLSGKLSLKCDELPAVDLLAGDAAIVVGGGVHVVGDSQKGKAISIHDVVTKDAVRAHRGLKLGRGRVTSEFIGGVIAMEGAASPHLKTSLPPIMVVRGSAQAQDALLPSVIRLLEAQSRDSSAGTNAVMTHLVTLMFMEAARVHLAAIGPRAPGWARAVIDPSIGPLLGLIHASPGRDWSLAEMANEAGVSRTIFHERFTELVGASPMAYLRDYRLQMASDLIRDGSGSMAEIAAKIGYGSQGAFCSAFKKWAGVTPGEFRAQHHLRASK